DIQQQAALVARVNLPVLVLGESGTGKEVLARYIHSMSPQAQSAFLKVNCAAMPSELLESELFGYEPGAFTGKAFREHLYCRLSGFCVILPPLRERRDDIPVLLRHFLSRYTRELGLSDVQPSLSVRLEKACLRAK